MTTANSTGEEYEASVAAVCLDLDVALLAVADPAFWASEGGLAALPLEPTLPRLRQPIMAAGKQQLPIGITCQPFYLPT